MFDLVAHLRIVDRATRPLQSVTRSIASTTAGFARMSASVVGASAAIGGVAAAVGLYTKAIKGASNLEQNMISMEHFIGLTTGAKDAKKAAEDYLSYLRKNADVTPFSTNDVIDSGRRLINVASGDISMAKKLLTISENMAALTPGKSLNDAVEAIADLTVGETERMKEFGFKITQKDIKAAGGAMKILNGRVAKMFDGGADKLSKSGYGMWSTITGSFSSGISDMGVETLNMLKPQLQKVADYLSSGGASSLITQGSKLMAGFTNEIIKGSYKAIDYIKTHFINNPEFQKLTTFGAKVEFIFKDIMESFNVWMDGGGRAKIEGVASSTIDIIAKSMKASEPLLEAAGTLGASIAQGMITGFWDLVKDDPKLAAILGGGTGAAVGSMFGPVGTVAGGVIGAGGTYVASEIQSNSPFVKAEKRLEGMTNFLQESDAFHAKYGKNTPMFTGGTISPAPKKTGVLNWLEGQANDLRSNPFWTNSNKHSGGISSVPRDNYPAILHRGESVLHRGEARDYRNSGGSGGGATVQLNGPVHIHTEADYQTFVQRLARDIDAAGNAMGVA